MATSRASGSRSVRGSRAGEASTGVVPPEGGMTLHKACILLMGQRNSGKSSIRHVVFHKLPAYKTASLGATTHPERYHINSIIGMDIWDIPEQLMRHDDVFDMDEILGGANTIIWVIDAQEDLYTHLSMFHEGLARIGKQYPGINIEVFIHKTDEISEELSLDTKAEVIERTQRALEENDMQGTRIFYHLTSIYDHSIIEAMSKVVQRLNPSLRAVEGMLNRLCTTSGIEKAFLIDAASKIYVATDSTPGGMQYIDIYCESINFISAFTEIYGYERQEAGSEIEPTTEVSSKMSLSNGMVLHLKQVNSYLALACIISKDRSEMQGLVDFNIKMFENGLRSLLESGRGGTA